MALPPGETNDGVLRLDFDRRLMLQFCGSLVTLHPGAFKSMAQQIVENHEGVHSGQHDAGSILALGPLGAFWFGVFVTILIIGFVAWTAFSLLFVAHFATLSRFI
jgi:hypothetical protein